MIVPGVLNGLTYRVSRENIHFMHFWRSEFGSSLALRHAPLCNKHGAGGDEYWGIIVTHFIMSTGALYIVLLEKQDCVNLSLLKRLTA